MKPADAPTAPYEPLSPDDRAAVLKALESCPTLTAAARSALGERRVPAVIAAAKNDPEFGLAVEAAREAYRDSIRAEIHRRGVIGVEKPLSYQGVLTGYHIREYSDEMLKVAARLALKGEYLDKVTASDHYISGSIAVEGSATSSRWVIAESDLVHLNDEQKRQLASIIKAVQAGRNVLSAAEREFAAIEDHSTDGAIDAEYVDVLSEDDAAELARINA